MKNAVRSMVVLGLGAWLVGCASLEKPKDTADYSPTMPLAEVPIAERNGSLYVEATSVTYFQDTKARRVGDIITIMLTEQTNAKKSTSMKTDKSSDVAIDAPNIFGRTPSLKPMGIGTSANPLDMSMGLGSSQVFDGSGDSSLSNALSGRLTVTVAEVLGNGYLLVRGEKKLTINQGDEYVKISGIIRPQDVLPDNTVLSMHVADAKITYTGDGSIHDASTPGALTSLLNKLWPF